MLHAFIFESWFHFQCFNNLIDFNQQAYNLERLLKSTCQFAVQSYSDSPLRITTRHLNMTGLTITADSVITNLYTLKIVSTITTKSTVIP